MKIVSFNVNGFRSLIKSQDLIHYFSNFDIVAFQEMKLSEKTLDVFNNYMTDVFKYRYINIGSKPGYSGVAIMSKLCPKSYSTSLNGDKEGRFLQLEFNNFYLFNVYFPNSGPRLERLEYKQKFNKLILNKVNKYKMNRNIILLGDFNAIQSEIDTYDFARHRNKLAGVTDIEIKDFNTFLDNGLFNSYRILHSEKNRYSYFSYRFPSRINNKGILLDHILLTKNLVEKIKSVELNDKVYGSDHIPAEISLNDIF